MNALLRYLALFPRPKRGDAKNCPYCGALNEPDNKRCVECLRPI